MRNMLAIIAGTAMDYLAEYLSVALMLLAIAYIVAVVAATVIWLGAEWLLLTVPAGFVLGYPAMKVLARWSRDLTGE